MQNIEIREYQEYNEEEILSLYTSVGWSNYYEKPEMLRQAYAHSLCILGAYVNHLLVGTVRAVGDGHSILYIQDIIVLPDYQRQGIGSLLLKAVLEKYDNVYQKVLLTENQPDTVKFYKSIGFHTADKYNCVCFVNFTV